MASTSELPADHPVLHIWPKTDQLLSLDPACVSALLYLQLSIPNKFHVNYTVNPDASPSGQLPYLTHGTHSIAGFEAIAKYTAQMARNGGHHLDESLHSNEKAQNTARVSHVESSLGDLVAHVYYASSTNWTRQTRHILTSVLPIPQRYYVPDRLRSSYRPRLEAADLWDAAGIEDEEEQEKQRFSFRMPRRKTKKAMEKRKLRENEFRKKVAEKARDSLDVYARLLGRHSFFYGLDRPTTLDVVFAAHIHCLRAPLPDSHIAELLAESYPLIIAHCDRVLHRAFPDAAAFPRVVTQNSSLSIRSLLPSMSRSSNPSDSTAWRQQERKYKLMRWAFFGTAGLAFCAYLYLVDAVNVGKLVVEQMRIIKERALAEGEEEDEDIDEDVGEDEDEDEE